MAWNEPGGNGNNNDPWGGGGRGGGDKGPPDLDEALKKLQEKLNGIFGGSGAKSGGGGSSGGGHMSGGILAVLGVVALVVWFGLGVYMVDEQERGVVLRLGKYYETVSPGLHWNPKLIDEVTKVNVTRVRSHDHRALMLTEDENIVDVGLTVQYRIQEPKSYVLNVRDPEISLAHSVESALRHVVGTSEMHSVLTEGREVLGAAVETRIQNYQDTYGTGLFIAKVNVENTSPPSQVQASFDDVIKAREDEQRVKNEAEAYANGIIPEARGRAQRILEEANAYREGVVARAEGQSERFVKLLNEYQQAPEVTRERLYLDAVESVYSNTNKVFMDVDGGNQIVYLPLDRMVNRSSAGGFMQENSGTPRVALDDQSLREVTDQVVEQLRRRQSPRREGR